MAACSPRLSAVLAWAMDDQGGLVGVVRNSGLYRAVVSSSTPCRDILATTDIEHLFERRMDGVVARRAALEVEASEQAAALDDALVAVAAGRAGGYPCVVGGDRIGPAGTLRDSGAAAVVSDLAAPLEPL